jgi:hypothetical protein
MQAAFIVGLACSIAVLLMLQHVAALIVGSRKAAVVPWVALMLPAAFVNRVRATQEYPVLALMLLAIYATERSRTSWRWIGVVIAAACATTLVKGVFIVFVPIVCGLWILCVRENRHGDLRAWIGLVLSMAAVIAGTFAYEALYSRVTGDSFLGYYMPYRVGQISVAAQDVTTLVTGKLDNIGWYSARLLWFAFPGSLALLIAVWRKRPAGPGPNRLRQGSGGQEGPGLQGLLFALGAAGAYVAVMSFGATRSERFIFPAYFSIGIAGALVATRRWRFAANLETRAARARPYALPLAWLLLVLAALPFEMYVPYVKIR